MQKKEARQDRNRSISAKENHVPSIAMYPRSVDSATPRRLPSNDLVDCQKNLSMLGPHNGKRFYGL